ncbi:hypothetical protein OHV05_36765 (plasmid) [Kitasatospora sp. NBC_00070]|uniref:hypothetical protein n=1 Tax=Kitasatospora sp. NBC_00070 TaxID=2975962 RepID=UPI00324E9038
MEDWAIKKIKLAVHAQGETPEWATMRSTLLRNGMLEDGNDDLKNILERYRQDQQNILESYAELCPDSLPETDVINLLTVLDPYLRYQTPVPGRLPGTWESWDNFDDVRVYCVPVHGEPPGIHSEWSKTPPASASDSSSAPSSARKNDFPSYFTVLRSIASDRQHASLKSKLDSILQNRTGETFSSLTDGEKLRFMAFLSTKVFNSAPSGAYLKSLLERSDTVPVDELIGALTWCCRYGDFKKEKLPPDLWSAHDYLDGGRVYAIATAGRELPKFGATWSKYKPISTVYTGTAPIRPSSSPSKNETPHESPTAPTDGESGKEEAHPVEKKGARSEQARLVDGELGIWKHGKRYCYGALQSDPNAGVFEFSIWTNFPAAQTYAVTYESDLSAEGKNRLSEFAKSARGRNNEMLQFLQVGNGLNLIINPSSEAKDFWRRAKNKRYLGGWLVFKKGLLRGGYMEFDYNDSKEEQQKLREEAEKRLRKQVEPIVKMDLRPAKPKPFPK